MGTGVKWILLPLFSFLLSISPSSHFAYFLRGPDHTQGVQTSECSTECQRPEYHDLKSESKRLRHSSAPTESGAEVRVGGEVQNSGMHSAFWPRV